MTNKNNEDKFQFIILTNKLPELEKNLLEDFIDKLDNLNKLDLYSKFMFKYNVLNIQRYINDSYHIAIGTEYSNYSFFPFPIETFQNIIYENLIMRIIRSYYEEMIN